MTGRPLKVSSKQVQMFPDLRAVGLVDIASRLSLRSPTAAASLGRSKDPFSLQGGREI